MNQADYQSHDALGLAGLVAKGEVGPQELLDLAFERVQQVNPALNAVIALDHDRASQAIARGLPDGPFRGVPFLLKDLYTDMTGWPLTNGSRLYADYVPDHDSTLVERYQQAGLVIFGRTTSPEFGLTATTESRLHGATRNPWNTEHSAGGSSGGSSAAVAAGVLPMANASDGGGSIRIPASCCGLFGLKPTRGRTPAGPDRGEGWGGMSTVHAVSRSVRDSAALLDATAGPDTGAPYWAEPPSRPFAEEVGADPGRLRIALQTGAFNGAPVHPDCQAAVEDAAKLCESLGHHVEEAQLPIDSEALARATGIIISASVAATVEDRATALGRLATPDDVEPVTWGMAERAKESSAADYVRAIQAVHATGRQVARFLQDYDIILSPTMAIPPAKLGVLSLENTSPSLMEALRAATGFTSLFNASGNPAMSVPLAWNGDGLPIGIQFAGRYGDEATLLRLGAQLDAARPWFDRRPQI
jgi:amidase/6-aminohexanoate-cyclic-dimer hydrolase